MNPSKNRENLFQTRIENLNLKKLNQRLTIAIVADIHLHGEKSKRSLALAIKEINKRRVDFVFLLGDYIMRQKDDFSKLKLLIKLKSKNGVFAVLGNHDYGMALPIGTPNLDLAERITKILRSNKVKVLANDSFLIDIGNSKLNISGVDDYWAKRFDLRKTFSQVNKLYPVLLLSHNPDIVLELTENQLTDLIISGHTHGYTVRLPKMGAICACFNTKLGRRYDKGFKRYGHRLIYISSGLCCKCYRFGVLPRIFNPPEIVFLQLNF